MRKLIFLLSFFIGLIFLVGCINENDIVMRYYMDECQVDPDHLVKDHSPYHNNAVPKHGNQNTDGKYAQPCKDFGAIICNNLEFKGEGYNADPNNKWYGAQYYLEANDIDAISPLTQTGEMTLVGWFKSSKSNITQTIISKLNEYRVFIENGTLKVTLWNKYGSPSTFKIKSNVTDGKWHFFAVVASISYSLFRKPKLEIQLYYGNGKSDTTKEKDKEKSNFEAKNTDNDLFIGATQWSKNSNPTNYFDGFIDELGMLDVAVSKDDIDTYYNNQKNHKDTDIYGNAVDRDCECQCGTGNFNAIADYHLDECEWDNNPNTYEIKNYGTGGDEYNASSFGNAFQDEGKVCRGGNFISDDTHDKALLPKNDIKLPNEYTLNVWIKFPLNENGHKEIDRGVYYFNIADRPGQGGQGDYIFFTHYLSNDEWTLNINDDSGKDYINFNPQNLNGWHMLTFVITNDGTKFYFDGDYNDSFSTHPAGEIGLLFNSDYKTGDNQPNWQSLGALADEFTIFDKPLSEYDIKKIYDRENNGRNWDNSTRNCPPCETQQEINGTFNAVDYVSGQCNALKDWDDNITTKIVNKSFSLTILAKDKDLNTPLEANITKVDFYEYKTNDCSGNYNIENICTNCGQTSVNGCLAVKNIKINKAVKCIKVHIEGNVTNPVNPIQESNSTDNFALRPYKFEITNIPLKIKSGKEFNITLKALDYEGNPSKNYNESVNINGNSPDLEYNISKGNCNNGNLKIINGGNFKNGEANVTLKYNEVGDINLTLKEVNGSEFALVDNDDTSLKDRLIGAYKTQISVIPDHFKINANFSNYDNNFTYLDKNLNLYSVLDINITAENEDNETTKNYNKECYAKDIDINISKILFPKPDLDNLIYYYKDAKNNDSDIFKQDIDQIIQIHYKETNFTTDDNGSTHLTLFINFERNSSKPVDPFDMNISEINVSDKEVNGNLKNIGKTLYYYGNLILFDEIANKNEFDTRENYFIVYDSNESDNKLSSNNEILPEWYLNNYHRNIDGNISDDNIVVSGDYNASDKINGVKVSVNSINNGKITFHVKRTDLSVNFAVIHFLEPNLKWLWYSKYGDDYNISNNSTCLNHFCFTITWQNNNEKGVIKSGTISGTESNTTENNVTKRGVKIFR